MVARRLGLEPDPPAPTLVVMLYLEAFYSLSRSRSNNGYGPLPLSINEISAWHRFTGSPLEPDALLYVAQQLDEAYLTWAANKR